MIYVDYNATTPLLPDVRDAMEPYLKHTWGNPSSSHSFGLQAHQAIDEARDRVALLVGAEPSQIIFTCSATEANNTALAAALEAPGKEEANCHNRYRALGSVEFLLCRGQARC